MTGEFHDNPKLCILLPKTAKIASLSLTNRMTNKPNQSFKSKSNNGHIDFSPNAANIMTNGNPNPVSLISLNLFSMTNEPDQRFDSNYNTDKGNIKFNPNAANVMDNTGEFQPNPGKTGILLRNAAKMASQGLTSRMTNKPKQSFKTDTNNGHIDCSPNAANIMTNGNPNPVSLISLYPFSMTNEPDQSFNSITNNGNIKFNPNAANIMDNKGNTKYNPNAANIMENRSIALICTVFIIWLWKS